MKNSGKARKILVKATAEYFTELLHAVTVMGMEE